MAKLLWDQRYCCKNFGSKISIGKKSMQHYLIARLEAKKKDENSTACSVVLNAKTITKPVRILNANWIKEEAEYAENVKKEKTRLQKNATCVMKNARSRCTQIGNGDKTTSELAINALLQIKTHYIALDAKATNLSKNFQV